MKVAENRYMSITGVLLTRPSIDAVLRKRSISCTCLFLSLGDLERRLVLKNALVYLMNALDFHKEQPRKKDVEIANHKL